MRRTSPGPGPRSLVIAGVAPYDADGLDWLAGMGEDNLEEFGVAEQGEPELAAYLEKWRPELAAITGDQIAASLASLLPPVDVEALSTTDSPTSGRVDAVGLARTAEGWCDDDLAFVTDWGFALADITVPVLIWQGSEDLMVPFAHGEWLAAHVPGATTHLEQGQGHLSIAVAADARWAPCSTSWWAPLRRVEAWT